MNGFELVAGVIGIFFAVGIVVGVLCVIALPHIRYYRHDRRCMNGADWQQLTDRDEDGGPPSWPGH